MTPNDLCFCKIWAYEPKFCKSTGRLGSFWDPAPELELDPRMTPNDLCFYKIWARTPSNDEHEIQLQSWSWIPEWPQTTCAFAKFGLVRPPMTSTRSSSRAGAGSQNDPKTTCAFAKFG